MSYSLNKSILLSKIDECLNNIENCDVKDKKYYQRKLKDYKLGLEFLEQYKDFKEREDRRK